MACRDGAVVRTSDPARQPSGTRGTGHGHASDRQRSEDRHRHHGRSARANPGHQARRNRRARGRQPGEARSRPGGRGDPRPCAARRARPEPGPCRRARRRRPEGSPELHGEQGMWLGPQGRRAGRAGHPARPGRRHRGWRHGEHERGAVHPEEGPLRHPPGARRAARFDDRRRPYLSHHVRPHGYHRGERREQVRHLPGRAGRVRCGEPAEDGRRAAGREVQGRDRAGRDSREEGRVHQVRHRRAPARGYDRTASRGL